MKVYLFLHVLGAILFVGNIVTAAFWKLTADRGGDPVIVHQAAKNVMLADWVFTVPGLVLLVVSGSLMSERAGYALDGLNWLTLSLVLFGLSGALWLGVLLPLQRAMIRRSEESVRAGSLTAAYRRASKLWAVFGTAATLLPVVVLYLMVAKTDM